MTLTAPHQSGRQADLPDVVADVTPRQTELPVPVDPPVLVDVPVLVDPPVLVDVPVPAPDCAAVEAAFSSAVEAAFGAALDALADVSTSLQTLRLIDDDALIVATRRAAAQRQIVDTHAALIAGEVARRSQHQLGSAGLAQRLGYRTTEELVRTTTGSTARDAVATVRVGRLLIDTQSEGEVDPLTGVIHETTEPWLAPVASALLAHTLSVPAAEAIRNGLGRPSNAITAEQLLDAARQLCIAGRTASTRDDTEHPADTAHSDDTAHSGFGIDADRLYRLARELREELDLDAVAVHEEIRRAQRSLTLRRQPDGMTRLVWIMDPETAAVGTELYDRLTSPRGTGPRFVDKGRSGSRAPGSRAPGSNTPGSDTSDHDSSHHGAPDSQAGTGFDFDTRSSAQLASDVFLELLLHGAEADSSELLGGGAPVVRVLVTLDALRARRGAGRIEGQTEAISIGTVERLACSGTASEIVFDDNLQPLNVGREQRMFTRTQRIALAARDGGCRFGGCERPPSWCEAHHIQQWDRDHGDTDVANGILLCRHHHLLLHNNGWEINRVGAEYSLIPPRTVDVTQQPRPMQSKSPAYRQLQRT